jgi:hypothetical protein
MEWLKKHKDAVYVMSAIALAVYTMMTSLHNVERRTDAKLGMIEKEISSMKTDIAIIKYVTTTNRLDIKQPVQIPKELAANMEVK